MKAVWIPPGSAIATLNLNHTPFVDLPKPTHAELVEQR